jgi:hypothetical protein
MPFDATIRVFLGILRVTERVVTGVPFVVQWTSPSRISLSGGVLGTTCFE